MAAQQPVADIEPLAEIPVGMGGPCPGDITMEFVLPRVLIGEGFRTLEIRVEGRVVDKGRRIRRGRVVAVIGGERRAGQHGERDERDGENPHAPPPLTKTS